MNMRSIYANPYKYAVECNIPFELAKIMCLKQRHFYKEERKHPMHCPNCKSKHLIFESGSYEEGYGDFIECDNCGETFDCDQVPNSEYANLTGWEDFDAVLYYSSTENKTEGWKEACGAKTHEEWIEFATKMITGRNYRQVDWRDVTKIRLLADFDGSFFNEREEFIAHRYSNTYFIFSNCESLEDVNCKVLEWLSRAADKSIPYRQDWRNKKFQKFMLDGINKFLNTNFNKDDIDLIYTYLGNACNHNRTLEFVRSGYDMKLLRKLENKEN